VAGGLALIGLALIARIPAAPGIPASGGFGPAAVLVPWLLATTLVALAEERILRGVLFTALDLIGGPVLAVVVTSLAFALMHVPVYGWHVVPLDLGVGIFLGGLRLATGRWLGPGIAHVVADVATWWL
jgi:membrane protease YdiL (CAAX protease family)